MVPSTLTTVMGQISCYTGQGFAWDEVSQSDFYYPPTPEECRDDMDPPTVPGPDGRYPVPIPGQTRMI